MNYLKTFNLSSVNLSILALIFLCCSCRQTISGKDEASFKASKDKLEKELSSAEKIEFEKALRVITLKAMSDKFSDPKINKGKSFDEISLRMVDGKSFSGIIDFAEDFLKKSNLEKKAKLKIEIDSLNKQKSEFNKKNAAIDKFKFTGMYMIQDEFFDEMIPYLVVTFTNKTKTDIIGEYMYRIDIFSKKTGKLIASQEQGGGFRDGFSIVPDEAYDFTQPLLSEARDHSKNLWKNAKYPIKDFAPYDLVIKVYPTKITTATGTIERENDPSFDEKILVLQTELKEIEGLKGTLDELELTR